MTAMATHTCVLLLDGLGFIVHRENSLFTPAAVITCLGFIIGAKYQTMQLTDSKKRNTKEFCQHILSAKQLSIRRVAKLLGTITCAFPGVRFGPLHY